MNRSSVSLWFRLWQYQKEGFPFDTQSGSLLLKNGVITSEDIIMDGPILKLRGAGSYNLVQDQLELAVAETIAVIKQQLAGQTTPS